MNAEPAQTPLRPIFNKDGAAAASTDRIPPHDIEAEMSLLGSMMLNRDAIGDILPIIHRNESSRFYRPDHRKIFEVLVDMYDRGDPVDLVTVRNELQRLGLLEEVGGVDYIVQLAESVPSHLHAEHYARLVCDKAMLRDLIVATAQMTDYAYSHHESAKEILDAAEHALFKVTDQRIAEQAEPVRAYIEEIFEQLSSREGHYYTGIQTGFLELDELLSGLQNGEMIVIAARPSMGKTALGLNMAENIATTYGKPVAFFSLEMSKQAIAQRLLCSRGKVDSHKLRRGMLKQNEIDSLHTVADELTKMPLFVDDSPGMSVLELRAKSRRLRVQHEIVCIIVDYLQLMHSPGKIESRQQEVAEISRGLKALARELHIPVVVMSQLNRNPEGRTDNRPRMSDLRESGAIEQDADVVLLLHREEYYKGESTPHELRGIAEVILAKQRNGPVGNVQLVFNQKFTRFDNLAIGAEATYVPGDEYESADDFSGAAPF
ncbi:MAG: replicative DNA helicase [Planctomycetota bacterium]|nr:MAG: replicative DNA helicase [Planctomycetota bacterium]